MKEGMQQLRKNRGIVAILVSCVFFIIIFFVIRNNDRSFVIIGNEKIFVDIAKTDDERERGLSGQGYLCDMCGMLFIFDSPGLYSFWMKDMRFDIDIIWIRGNQIVHLSQSLDHTKGEQVYSQPSEEIDVVLEVPAGFIDRKNLQIDQNIVYSKNIFE